jgi:hypothetical protein
MTEISFKSAGVNARVINRTGPTAIKPAGLPAGVVGTAVKGPAFVPVTEPTPQDFVVDFGLPTDTRANGPLASIEWLRNSQALTFLRVLGAGSGRTRETSGDNAGRVNNAGFIAGNQEPQRPGGAFGDNTYVTTAGSGDEGRTYLLGCFMKQSGSSTIFSDAGKPSEGVPVVRGLVMAASGVFLTLSSSRVDNNTPGATGTAATSNGAVTGSVKISSGRQEFVMLLNGFNNSTSTTYKNVLTASFDPTAPNYLDKIFNTDPFKVEEAGHLLYTDYKIHPALAIPTGSGIVATVSGAGAVSGSNATEDVAFLLTSSLSRNSGSSTVPNFENFEDRFKTAESVWVTSQKFGGTPENLFKISALSDGSEPNNKLKFSVENITPGTDAEPYGRFDLLVRDFTDNDKTLVALEAWRGLSLNPDSPQYVARIIGDTQEFFNFDAAVGSQKIVTTGIYENKSRLIRVTMADKVANAEIDKSAIPFGFRGAPHLVTSGTSPMPPHNETATGYLTSTNPFYDLVQIPTPFRDSISRGASPNKTADKGLYWGVQFEEKTSVAEPNASTTPESSILSLNKYLPNFHTSYQNVVVSNNAGAADTAANGILDADRFCNNAFTLGNVRITVDGNDLADTQSLADWAYVRQGGVSVSGSTRAMAATDLTDAAVRNVAKFSFYIHGGFDGTNILDKQMDEITNESVTEEMNSTNRGIADGPSVVAYNKALDIMADSTEVDIQLLTVPGIRHETVTDKGLLVTEDRFDALFLMDLDQYDVQNALVTSSNQILSVRYTKNNFETRGLNTSFGASYFPDVVLRDSFTGRTRIVPPTVAVLGAFAKNDAVGYPWFAPAGFTRGALETTDSAALRLSRPNMDTLQDGNINPLVSFAGSNGVVVWGQKTLLQTDSSLERVNVRRLLIDIRRKVKALANRLLFEPGRAETLARFSQLVNPVLKKIQDQKGLEKFLVRIDTSTTTQADIENRTIRGKIFLTPTKTLEFLSVDFVVTNQLEG